MRTFMFFIEETGPEVSARGNVPSSLGNNRSRAEYRRLPFSVLRTPRKTESVRVLEKLTGGPVTFALPGGYRALAIWP
jgi:hypothetical protein